MDDHHVAPEPQRRQVRRVEQQLGVARQQRQDTLLPQVPGAVRERGRRREHARTEPVAQLAGPALDAAELRPRGRPGVERDHVASKRTTDPSNSSRARPSPTSRSVWPSTSESVR